MTFNIQTTDDTIIGIIEGRLDTAASSQFAADVQPILDSADKNIVLDCSKMEFISSSGLRIFLTIRKSSIAHGGKVTIKGASPEVKQVFTITGFTSLFDFE
ncbi:MAG: STAS domain-containing protein [Prevotellaceae bacterium]|nr:STAS domain-containing protein [Candidatus Minthosoma equi]